MPPFDPEQLEQIRGLIREELAAMAAPPTWYTVREVAKQLGISHNTLFDSIARGDCNIPGICHVGRRILISSVGIKKLAGQLEDLAIVAPFLMTRPRGLKPTPRSAISSAGSAAPATQGDS